MFAFRWCVLTFRALALKALLNPALLLRVGDVQILDTDIASIGCSHGGNNFTPRGMVEAD